MRHSHYLLFMKLSPNGLHEQPEACYYKSKRCNHEDDREKLRPCWLELSDVSPPLEESKAGPTRQKKTAQQSD